MNNTNIEIDIERLKDNISKLNIKEEYRNNLSKIDISHFCYNDKLEDAINRINSTKSFLEHLFCITSLLMNDELMYFENNDITCDEKTLNLFENNRDSLILISKINDVDKDNIDILYENALSNFEKNNI